MTQTVTFVRPATAPGWSDDLLVAEQLELSRRARQEAAARQQQLQIQARQEAQRMVEQQEADRLRRKQEQQRAQREQEQEARLLSQRQAQQRGYSATDDAAFSALAFIIGVAGAAAEKRSESTLPPLPPPPDKQKFRCKSAGFGNVECTEY